MHNIKHLMIEVVKNKGNSAIYSAIDKTINDFIKLDYHYFIIKDSIHEYFAGINSDIDNYINRKGY